MTPADRSQVEDIMRSIDTHIATTHSMGLGFATYLLTMLKLELGRIAYDLSDDQLPDSFRHSRIDRPD